MSFFIRLGALAYKELLHMVRDQQVVYMALGMPLVMLLLFGYAVSFDVEELPIAVLDHDRTPAARALLRRLEASDAFVVRSHASDGAAIETLMRRGTVRAGVVIPAGFARQLARGEQATYQLLLDGADGTTARIALAYAFGATAARAANDTAHAAAPLLEPRVRALFNPALRSALFIVPGLAAVIIGILAVLMSTITVAREWERGSMEQLFATPVDRLSVVLGKLLPYVAIGLLQLLLVLTAGAWLFGVPLHGSLLTLLAAAVLFLAGALGQGLLISMVTRNQQVATQLGAISGVLPNLLLSGFIFPPDNMPLPMRVLSHAVPARYMVAVMRGVLLQGKHWAQLWPQFVGLALVAAALLTVSTLRFRRSLD
ncbi:MAG: ABC transporter permease [Proteobacteria bacterium]|nr:ABC transporter permease [Pseudomonadota bacterium]